MKVSFINTGLLGVVALAATMISTSGSAKAATTWEFDKPSPVDGGWTYDTSHRGYGNGTTRFPIVFSSTKVSTSGGKLLCKSDDLKAGPATVYGGGIKKTDGFSTNDISAKCTLRGDAASMKRSQASFWLDKQGDTSYEVDMLEFKPNAGAVCNFISWSGGGKKKLEGKTDLKWNAAVNTTHVYRLTFANNKYTVTMDGGNTQTYATLARTLGKTIIIHNKAWRFNPNPGEAALTDGPVATLECDYVTKK